MIIRCLRRIRKFFNCSEADDTAAHAPQFGEYYTFTNEMLDDSLIKPKEALPDKTRSRKNIHADEGTTT